MKRVHLSQWVLEGTKIEIKEREIEIDSFKITSINMIGLVDEQNASAH